MGMTVQRCTGCKPHPFQDKKYGNSVRAHNHGKSKSGGIALICTVCGKRSDAGL